MNAQALAYATYWRNSLADAALGRGTFSSDELEAAVKVSPTVLAQGQLDPLTVAKLFEGLAADVESLTVILRPWLYQLRLEHGQRRSRGIADFITPLLSKALLRRDGRLYPQSATFVPRDLLEPMERGSFALGDMDTQDAYLTTRPFKGLAFVSQADDRQDEDTFAQDWRDYLGECSALLQAVAPGFPEGSDLLPMSFGLLCVEETDKGACRHLLPLYDHLREASPDVPLFERYALENAGAPESCRPLHAGFSERLAHSSDRYPLAPAQRQALNQLLVAERGEILAVNGPPGTGKTTLLLSVVATLWARAALVGGEPPVIVAASTNNQAVTNVIDAFGEDFAKGEGPLADRWLPAIRSFGAYFPAKGKEAEQSKRYQTRAFFDAVENAEYLDRAQAQYLQAGRRAFPEMATASVAELVERLRQELQAVEQRLVGLELAWTCLRKHRTALQMELGDAPEDGLRLRQERLHQAQAERDRARQRLEGWERWRADESILYALFAWLPPVKAKRLRRARLAVRALWPEAVDLPDWRTLDEIEAVLRQAIGERQAEEVASQQQYEQARQLLEAERQALADWLEAVSLLAPTEQTAQLDLTAVDDLADTHLRFSAFLLTTHYWEGRWLLEMASLRGRFDQERKQTGPKAVRTRWYRRMKLTPCLVSTFFMLPSLLEAWRYESKDVYSKDYLYDFIDLLIVDEAGQVLPEVAGAPFALARQALVIGDTLQIEPIWAVPPRVDIGNAIGAGLISGADYRERYPLLRRLGKSAANGSVMRIAQQVCRYHQEPQLARGLYLFEHRRCYDEIVAYCNELCYQGKLQPLRGTRPEDKPLPALGYLHIGGLCEAALGNSRQNLLEAHTLAAWLLAHRQSLSEAYGGTPIAKIVGVVTPFAGQVAAITLACQAIGIEVGGEHGMTVGTVHALQGAQRPVVIFSAVYSKHADGGFIDRRSSLLNVAVSRAKDSFLVFGDLDMFERASASQPRGLLARHLFTEGAQALEFESQPREDLQSISALTVLRDAAAHDAFLLQTFAQVRERLFVVTPMIRLHCLHEIGVLPAMREAVSRGVTVRVYTDPGWDTDGKSIADVHRAEAQLQAVERELGELGVDLVRVRRVHSKLVMGDLDLYCPGSFNWFSARRDSWARHETSLAYRGPALSEEIEATLASLEHLIIAPARETSH